MRAERDHAPTPRRVKNAHQPWLFILLLGGIGVAMRIWDTALYGPGVMYDSVAYVSAAESLLAGEGFYLFDGVPLASWPPLFPSLIAFVSLVGIDTHNAARFINAGVFGGIVILSATWLFALLRARYLAYLASVAVLLSPAMAHITSYILSEPIYILFSLAFIRIMASELETPNGANLLLAAIFAGLAVSTRFIGVTVIGTGGLLLLFQPNIRLMPRLKRCIIFGVVASAPFLSWLAYNYFLTGKPMGYRPRGGETLPEVAQQLALTLESWYLPGANLQGWALALAALVPSLAMATALFVAWRRLRTIENGWYYIHVLPLIIYTTMLAGLVFNSALTTPVGNLQDRTLSPAYLPVFLLFFVAIDRSLPVPPSFAALYKVPRLAVTVLAIVAWLIWFQGNKLYLDMRNNLEYGAGDLASIHWHTEFMSYLKNKRLKGYVFSNHPMALYYHTGIKSHLSPRVKSAGVDNNIRKTELAYFHSRLERHSAAFLVWFDFDHSKSLIDIAELRDLVVMRPMHRVRGGTLYTVYKKKRRNGK